MGGRLAAFYLQRLETLEAGGFAQRVEPAAQQIRCQARAGGFASFGAFGFCIGLLD